MKKNKKKLIITFDTDWCPKFMLDYSLEFLSYKNIPVTIFATDKYEMHKNWNKLWKFGIHPNFDNKYGFNVDNAEKEVERLKEIYPDAKSCRTHKLIWWSNLEQILKKNNINLDSSIQVFDGELKPFITPTGLIRIPINWSDGMLIRHKITYDSFIGDKEIYVVSFHPIHIWCNTKNLAAYRDFSIDCGRLDCARKNILDKYRKIGDNIKNGVRTNFIEMINNIENYKVISLEDSY